jgi:exodeoxyribonuclease VIII
MYSHLMIDLETMGGPPNGAIVGIGAIPFNISTLAKGPPFYLAVNLADSVNAGMKIDPATVIFWMRQSKEARDAIINSTVPLAHALTEFAAFKHQHAPNSFVVGNGSSFDLTILGEAFKYCGIATPWQYWQERCFRTLAAMFQGVVNYDPKEKTGVAHNAADDCDFQVNHLFRIKELIKNAGI